MHAITRHLLEWRHEGPDLSVSLRRIASRGPCTLSDHSPSSLPPNHTMDVQEVYEYTPKGLPQAIQASGLMIAVDQEHYAVVKVRRSLAISLLLFHLCSPHTDRFL